MDLKNLDNYEKCDMYIKTIIDNLTEVFSQLNIEKILTDEDLKVEDLSFYEWFLKINSNKYINKRYVDELIKEGKTIEEADKEDEILRKNNSIAPYIDVLKRNWKRYLVFIYFLRKEFESKEIYN